MKGQRHYRYGLMFSDGTPHELYTNYIVYTGGLVCGRNEVVHEVVLEETDEEHHDMVAWRYTGNEDVDFIFKNKVLLSCAFPYGLENEIKANKGEVVYLKLISATVCSEAKDLSQHRAKWDTDD